MKQTEDFIENLGKYIGRYTLLEDERLSQDEFILGFHDGKWYVALSNKDLGSEINKYVQKLIQKNPFENMAPSYGSGQTNVNQTFEFDDRHFRVCAKIIFNYLAFVKGQQFVLQECFDPLREWIVKSGENKFASLTGQEVNHRIPFPDQAHKLFIFQKGKSLVGYISFYGEEFGTVITLCDDFKEYLEYDGFICDW